ncbi:MAG: glutaredoxin family protein, partial [Gaiellaceae bacterium]
MGDLRAAADDDACRGVRPRGRARGRGDGDAGALPVAEVVLFGAVGCHLCERAREQLEELRDELGFELREVEISGDPALEERCREWLPVVELDGEWLLVYHVQPNTLRQRMA